MREVVKEVRTKKGNTSTERADRLEGAFGPTRLTPVPWLFRIILKSVLLVTVGLRENSKLDGNQPPAPTKPVWHYCTTTVDPRYIDCEYLLGYHVNYRAFGYNST